MRFGDGGRPAVILTVTLNAALDVSYQVDAVVPGASHRVREVHARAGGKGINVGRILADAGHDVLLTGFVGGTTGDRIRADLAASGLAERLVPIAAESRRTVSVVSRATGDATLFNEPGPDVTAAEWSCLLDVVSTVVGDARVVVLSGSLPPGVPVDAYASLVRIAKDAGARTVVDADGVVLMTAVAAGPDAVKPNAPELLAATGVADPGAAMERLLAGGAGAVVATFGQDGLMARTPAGAWRVWLDRDLASINPTGAGDAVAAAIAAGFAVELPWPELLTDAVTWSAAAVMSPVAGALDRELVERLRHWVKLEELDAARLDG